MNKLWINLKSWYGVLFLVLLAGGVLWFVLNGMPYVNNLRANWEAKRLQAQWEKPYREDKYGGKTPEETYDMFLDALRKGDTTLASKYFVVGKQDNWLKTFQEYQSQNLLVNLIGELEQNRKFWTPQNRNDEEVRYTYSYTRETPSTTELPVSGGKTQKITLPAGRFNAETIFSKNTMTNIWIWKISQL
ncbi:MAG: hypothetical protein A2915_03440 [Candidatus Yanofskybacteria bacterium RIFCSPLOWO2_01_FULL_41_34]|uniref:Uncharacterized protein n=1 Tax=Candidatus Yanofskybacteria bacterium RIFCSPHIGHO2_01_FULL_41_26 TaxID=1802661 RepID=A0A1F8EF71_9BACT|nr:MAG: hypothetical protein A2649_01335 [Candidatus Yanofskybacteria bacterium RIFCSPHIGHO2_01_FULL_41_26]OGN21084.1 MAG: hypothetical protein A2915_03440 [Candidatus Yanofskybacteria bacterium RIFCSPLOWO2_01_FULL_41_34]